MHRIWESLLDVLTASPSATAAVLIFGPLVVYIIWCIVQVLGRM